MPGASYGTAIESVSTTWGTDLYITATPVKDSDDAVFAVKLVLENRSKKNTARLRTFDIPRGDFGLYLEEKKIGGNVMTLGDPLGPVDSIPESKITTRVIYPEATASFCLKLHEHLPSATILSRVEKYKWFIITNGTLYWELSGDVKVKKAPSSRFSPLLFLPALKLGEFKASVQKRLDCGK